MIGCLCACDACACTSNALSGVRDVLGIAEERWASASKLNCRYNSWQLYISDHRSLISTMCYILITAFDWQLFGRRWEGLKLCKWCSFCSESASWFKQQDYFCRNFVWHNKNCVLRLSNILSSIANAEFFKVDYHYLKWIFDQIISFFFYYKEEKISQVIIPYIDI